MGLSICCKLDLHGQNKYEDLNYMNAHVLMNNQFIRRNGEKR